MSDPVIDRLNASLEGRYRIERELGEGGMATVYLADDLRHERKVALKVLKPELTAVVGAERFLAEIKTTANLQHPHILPLYDSGEADSFLFYVMPWVEGESLRDRLDREKQLPVEEAVRIARAVASALDYAHRHGVIHRDIKPANVLMQDDEPVVGDFGIALAVGAAGGARLTETGLSLGTPYYMSPEQATGDQALGPATDVYALGAVLYEMLTGDPPYTGSTAQAVLGKIIQGGPVSATAVRATIPRNVDGAIRKALERLPADRFADAQAFSKALADPGYRYGEPEAVGAAGSQGLWNPLSYALLAATLVLATTLGVSRLRSTAPEPVTRNVVRISAPFEAGEEPLAGISPNRFTLTPDGSALIYVRQLGPEVSLWMRRWDDLGATPIRNAERGSWPSVSPDGSQLAFQAGGDIKVVSLDGGPARTLAPGYNPHWASDGASVFLWRGGEIYRVPAAGGAEVRVHERSEEWAAYFVWDVLPGDRIALLWVVPREAGPNRDQTFELDLETGETRLLVNGYAARYVPTGHLLYTTSDGTLMAAPFDPVDGVMTGSAVPLADRVPFFSISDDGTLFSNFGSPVQNELELVWVDRNGVARPVDAGWTFDPSSTNGNRSWKLSPDGTRIAVKIQTDQGPDIWIKPLPNGPLSRLTFYDGEDRFARWSPDGETVTFLSDREGAMRLWSRRADGTGGPQLVLDREIPGLNEAYWVPGGEWLLLRAGGVGGVVGGRDIFAMHVTQDTALVPLVVTDFDESAVEFSPDGRWMAYQSNETGRREVYVRPFPDVDSGKWQVSKGGGRGPLWAHSGRELFYIADDNQVMAASIDPGPPFTITGPTALFTLGAEYYFANNTGTWDIALDDQAFLLARSPSSLSAERTYRLVLNFFEELKERVPN